MRILYVVTAAGWGGATQHVVRLMEADLKNGHQVGLASAPEPRLMEEASALGVNLFPNRHFVRAASPWRDLRALWPVFGAIREFDPDLVSAHSTKAGYAARLAGLVLQKPVVFTAHGWAFTEGRSKWKRHLLAMAERLAARATTRILCVSEHDRDLALELRIAKPDKVRVIHNGVDPAALRGADGTVARSELGRGSGNVLTMIGRLSSPKDPFTVLEALRRAELPCHLLLVGRGELLPAVQDRIAQLCLADKVILTGERRDVPAILAASDVLVLSSRWEGLPYTIIEAMMAGLPVVATRVGGVPELVEDGVTGFLVAPQDSVKLAEALQKLLDDPELRRKMGEAGRAKALKEFTLDRMLAETQKVYEEVIRERGHRKQGLRDTG